MEDKAWLRPGSYFCEVVLGVYHRGVWDKNNLGRN